MTHEMKLNPVAFDLIKNNKKNIEVRLYDEKRRNIQIGDEIIFSELPEMENKLKTKVTALLIYKDFYSLYSNSAPEDFGGESWSVEQLVENIYQYYSKEDEEKYGVLGIKLELSDDL